MQIQNFPCPVCDSNDYHNTGLHPDGTLVLCKNCGALWQSRDNTKEADILEFYRKDYRSQPDHKNLVYTQNKLMYIDKFAGYFFKDKKGLVCTDIGCATGYVANWLRMMGHKATGTEYTIGFRRFAEHFYGIPVTETIEKKHKYDFILFYHTLEHMYQPDKKLLEAMDCLKDDGRIMVSVPQFLHAYDDPAALGVHSFANLYHKNHINMFSLQAIKNLFAKIGLEIEKEDTKLYGMTFMLKKGKKADMVKEDWEAHQKILESHKAASAEFEKGQFHVAFQICPRFPMAWVNFIQQTIGKDPSRQADEWQNAFKALPGNNKILMGYAYWLQAQERYDEAEKAFDELFHAKPNADWLFQRGMCLALLKRYGEAMQMFRLCAKILPMRWTECMDWAAKCACAMPNWEERAVESVKEELLKINREHIAIEPKDHVMDNAR
jgi:tetratricopeptide (TPR) repeat protein